MESDNTTPNHHKLSPQRCQCSSVTVKSNWSGRGIVALIADHGCAPRIRFRVLRITTKGVLCVSRDHRPTRIPHNIKWPSCCLQPKLTLIGQPLWSEPIGARIIRLQSGGAEALPRGPRGRSLPHQGRHPNHRDSIVRTPPPLDPPCRRGGRFRMPRQRCKL